MLSDGDNREARHQRRARIAGAIGGVTFGLCIAFFIALFFGAIEPVPSCKPGKFTNCIQGARR